MVIYKLESLRVGDLGMAVLIATVLFSYSCSNNEALLVPHADPQIKYSGRIDTLNDEGAELFWSGSSIKLNFEGESISAMLKDESGDNYYNIMVDNKEPTILRIDTTKSYHPIASGLSKGEHTVEIFRRTEWDRGKSTFYGFKIEGDARVLPKSKSSKRSIEFYGDSITAGYAVEDTTGQDRPDSTFTNNYVSYAAITARHLSADYRCICRSGIGITVSWIPDIMPEIYDRLDPTDPESKWDFSDYSPDVVVVNLFQNDSWIVNLPELDEFKKRFGTEAPDEEQLIDAYQDFLLDIRRHYPDAHIICSLGCMDASKEGSVWMEFIEEAAGRLSDEKIHTHFMPYIEAIAHPSLKDQQTMANHLIKYIEDTIDW